MASTVSLVVTAGPIRGRRFDFTSHDTFLFGRAHDCHARLAEADVSASRHHFLLEVNPPLARLRDLGSLNGTRVNGIRHGGQGAGSPSDVELHDGDEIRVGATCIQVEIPRAACQETGGLSSLLTASDRPGQALSPLGDSIGPYSLERLLGTGGMGAVYLARRSGSANPVALKVMLPATAPDETAQEAFLREIEVTRSLRHPNIVALLDVGRQDRRIYFALEYCGGGSAETLRRLAGGSLPLATVVRIATDALAGLAAAHHAGFVHRDIKPDNVLLTDDGTARLADFGLAKSFQRSGLSGMTATGAVAGTFFFMPREQLTSYRDVRPVSDVWSMAATLYHLLTGQYARDFGSNRDPLAVILRGSRVPLRDRTPSVPTPLAEVLDRALEDDPAKRYPTASEFADALAQAR